MATNRVWQEGVTADMRDKLRDAFTVSGDGRRVRFGLGYGGEKPVLFDLAASGFRTRRSPRPARAAQDFRPRRQRLGEQHSRRS